MGKQRFNRPFMLLIVVAGAALCAASAWRLPAERIDLGFLLLSCLTLCFGSRMGIEVTRLRVQITVSDTLIFLTILLYGGEAAVLLGAAEALCSSFRFSKLWLTRLFNSALLACSTFVTVATLHCFFGSPTELPVGPFSDRFVTALGLMALLQFAVNSGLAALRESFKHDHPFLQIWKQYYLWTSVTYFAGAVAAGLTARLIGGGGFYAIGVTVPIIAIIYFTYQTYRRQLEATAAQAAQAERHLEEIREREERFRHAAYHDALTGLPNRVTLTERLQSAIGRARNDPASTFALLFLDLDRFKNINDSIGHAAGDELLVVTAQRLSAELRPDDTVVRLGGDEFALLLEGVADEGEAMRAACRLQERLAQPFMIGGHEVYTTASIGIALSSAGYLKPEDVLRDADAAMYHAKERGKARHELFDEHMHLGAVRRLQMESALRRAVEREEFEVHYQPIVALDTEQLAGFEALVRWRHPERGLVAPAEFIPLAEETGMIKEIGRLVLYEACRQMREWQLQAETEHPLTLNVNLSGKQFTQPDLVAQIGRVLEETGFNPRFLNLEITESVVMQNAEAAILMLQQLRALGISLSIDDFGTGYSSLSYLHRFPTDTLKVDRSFVGRMGDSGGNFEIVRTIVTLAANLGMDVVAEGIETPEQLAQLKVLKCGYGQGYLFSKPLDAHDTLTLIRGQGWKSAGALARAGHALHVVAA